MIRNDYLMRSIQQLSQAFGQILSGKDIDSPQHSLDRIEACIADALNIRPEFLFSEDIATVGEFDPRLAAELGRMFSLHACTSIAANRTDLARLSTPWAIHCLSHALGQIDTHSALIAESELTAFLRHDVAQTYAAALALPAYEALFDFARRNRRITQAEDALFAAISLGASTDVVDAGRLFFSELLNMDEEELARSQTTRAEINEVLAELRSNFMSNS